MSPSGLLFGISVVVLAYTYAGYPLLLWLRVRGRERKPAAPAGFVPPSLSLLIPVYNEERAIAAKLENALALEYPRDRLEVVVVSDGSTDGTERAAARFLHRGVKLVVLSEHRGKAAAINRAVSESSGDLVVFTDATAIFEKEALRRLAAAFADPAVGVASGELILREESAAGGDLRVDYYWRLEKFIRRAEGMISSCAGATGAIYAVRRRLLRPLPEDTLLDDLIIPLEVVRRGRRVVFVEQARAREEKPAGLKQEFRRKVRTLSGNYQAFAREGWSLIPGLSPIAFFLISHKLLRLLSPLLLLLALAASAFGGGVFFRTALAVQLIFYLAALAGWAESLSGRKPGRLTAIPLTFALLNAAALKAFALSVVLRRPPSW